MGEQVSAPTVVIVNPGAGAAEGTAEILDRLARLGPVRIEETSAPGDARAIAEAAASAGAERVVAVGGDGTIHEVVNGLWHHRDRCALGIVPAGTGNDTARSLDLPLGGEEAVELILAGSLRPIDLVSVELDGGEREIAVNAITGGFGGEVAERTTAELKERWGPLAYARSAADTLSEIPCFRVRLDVDGESTGELRAYSVVVANGPYAARGMPVALGARPDDGMLSVHVVLEAPIPELLSMVPALLLGKIPESEHYLTWECETLSVASARPMEVSIDGERRTGRRFRYEVVPAGLRVYGA